MGEELMGARAHAQRARKATRSKIVTIFWIYYRFALAHAHLIFRMPTKIELSVYNTDCISTNIHSRQRPNSRRLNSSLFLRIFLLSFRYWIDSDCHCPFRKRQPLNKKRKKKQRRRKKCAKVKTEIEFIRFFPFNFIRAVANTQYLRIFAYSGHFNQPLIVLFTGHRCVRDGYFGYCH